MSALNLPANSADTQLHGQRGGELAAQLRRERLVDMESRLGVYRRRAFAVLALALIASGPWIGFWFLIPLGAALVASTIADALVRARRTRTAGPRRLGRSAA